jgi:predicted Zn-ribbon and HTH transcriptional regulator
MKREEAERLLAEIDKPPTVQEICEAFDRFKAAFEQLQKVREARALKDSAHG